MHEFIESIRIQIENISIYTKSYYVIAQINRKIISFIVVL